MTKSLTSRIVALEQKSNRGLPLVAQIICEGDAPNATEQAWIDEQQAQGRFVIVRTIIDPDPVDLRL